MTKAKSVKTEDETIMNTPQELLTAAEMILESLKDLSILEIRQVIDGGCEIIRRREDQELEELDQRIRELEEQRNQIRPRPAQESSGNKREIRPVVNPKNPDEKYTLGKHPAWLDEMLKESLGDQYGNAEQERTQIWKWRKQ